MFHEFVDRADAERLVVAREYLEPSPLLVKKTIDKSRHCVDFAFSFDKKHEPPHAPAVSSCIRAGSTVRSSPGSSNRSRMASRCSVETEPIRVCEPASS